MIQDLELDKKDSLDKLKEFRHSETTNLLLFILQDGLSNILHLRI